MLSPEVQRSVWYVAFSKPRQEQTALTQLLRQEYDTYLPQMTQWRRREGAWQGKVVPMFPRYLFVRPSRREQSIAPIRSTMGVTSLVRFGIEFARVRPALIQAIHELEVWQAEQTGAPARPQLAAGQSVKVQEGPFAGLQAVVHASARDRVIILLEILGQEARVQIDPDMLQVA